MGIYLGPQILDPDQSFSFFSRTKFLVGVESKHSQYTKNYPISQYFLDVQNDPVIWKEILGEPISNFHEYERKSI